MNLAHIVSTNTFTSKSDFERVLCAVTAPALKKLGIHSRGLLNIGGSRAHYSERTGQAEGFLRLLWGLAPYYRDKAIDKDFTLLAEGIAQGCDRGHKNYWGTIRADFDQLMVEMAPLAVFITLNKDKFFSVITAQDKQNVFDWLNQINTYEPHTNNWLFFRILVNVMFHLVYGVDNRIQNELDFAVLERYYLGGGWYHDGNPNQRDYYIAFAIHYYSLFYVYLYEEIDPARCAVLKARACEFAKDFRYWFDAFGRGIPFGRSMTYRFAQASFWSAFILVFANDAFSDFPLLEAKYHLQENLRFWIKQPIFDGEGILKIGYAYENLIMAEQYNSPGSPYWALKAFAVLALDTDNEIFSKKAMDLDPYEPLKKIPGANMLISRSKDGGEVQAFVAGQSAPWARHGAEKYAKFVYSTNFGFNVSVGLTTLEQGCFDNTLALSEQDGFFRVMTAADSYEVTNEYTQMTWKPWADVEITSVIVPLFPYHIRLHKIKSHRKLTLLDGGFSVPADDLTSGLFSSIKNIAGYDENRISDNLPNANLVFPCVVYPYLLAEKEAGSYLLISLVYGNTFPEILNNAPKISINMDCIQIDYEDKTIHVMSNI